MKKFLFMAFAAIALWGCGDASNDIEITDNTRNPNEMWWGGGLMMRPSSHFITEFVLVSKVMIKINAAGGLDIKLGGGNYSTYRDEDYKYYKEAKSFSEFYGDTNYIGEITGWLHPALAYPIDKMTISCTKDFDAEHPAGKPLDDIVNLDYSTYYKFIKSGYRLTFDNPLWFQKEEEVLSSPLNSINADVTTLAKVILSLDEATETVWENFFGRLVFTSTPAEPGEYNFTLETTINGKVYKSEFSYTFE